MPDRVMGLEFEYAVTGEHGGVTPGSACRSLMMLAGKRLRGLPGLHGRGLFLQNGARLYEDYGHHPEYATPETDHPTECVTAALAGDAILRDLVQELRDRGTAAVLYKTNVDYRHRSCWAGHESYEIACEADTLPPDLLPFFATRPLLGAGGLNPFCSGIEFVLSPRLLYFESEISDSTTSDRGMFNTRRRPLAEGCNRLHVIIGETFHSHTAMWMRVATTALVTAAAAAGLRPGRAVVLRDHVAALHGFCRDPDLQLAVPTRRGDTIGALDIQRHYLATIEDHVDHPCMPTWAAEACTRWRDLLQRLEHRNGSWTLDWQVKRALYADRLMELGIDLNLLPRVNRLLGQFNPAAERVEPRRLPMEHVTERILSRHGVSRDDLAAVRTARDDLCALDMTFHQLAPDPGLHAHLDTHRDHRICAAESIERATTEPPPRTRARPRGAAIRELSGAAATADWHCVRDAEHRRCLTIDRPRDTEGRWTSLPAIEPPDDAHVHMVSALYNRGDMARTAHEVRRWRELCPGRRDLLPYLAWAEARMGRLSRALEVLGPLEASEDAVDYLSVHRFAGLRPHGPGLHRWVSECERLARGASLQFTSLVNALNHIGYIAAREGRLDDAEMVLREAAEHRNLPGNRRRVEARVLADLADVLRVRGRTDEARSLLEQSRAIHEQHHFDGERAESWMTVAAKLAEDRDEALGLLRRARPILTRFGSRISLARVLALDARLTPTRRTAARRRTELETLRAETPDLRTCPLLTEIMDDWSEWERGASRRGDRYWLI